MSRAAVIQMTSATSVEKNLVRARQLLEQAVERGAKLAVLPENVAIMGAREGDKLAVAEDFGAGPIQTFIAHVARELGIWIVAGTLPIKSDREPLKVAGASLVFDAEGRCVARYDKIHLFDVDIPHREERYRESNTVAAGRSTVVIDTPIGRLGLAVCYDMRFPEQFRSMLDEGAQIFSLPSAFTTPTGKVHWDLLVRARAVDNLCFVLAAAQWGSHESGRETWGDSMIVDPWGTVLGRLPHGEGVVVTDIDLRALEAVRERFPATAHRRFKILSPSH
jgi:deaminated glutathione amidase